MKKDKQIAMNNYVMKNYDVFKDTLQAKYYPFFDWVKLRSCQACVAETEDFYILKSYNTIVAFINKYTGQKFDILRYVYGYTSTSAQHIAKFFSDYGDFRVLTYTYRDI